MSGAESKQVVLDYLEAAANGDMERVTTLLSPEVRVWLPGPPHWGAVLTREQYLASFGGFSDAMAGEFKTKIGPIVAEDDRVAIQMESWIPLRNGKTYNNQYHMYFVIDDGKIVILKGYQDTAHFVECFDGRHAILGQPHRHTNLFD